MCYTFSYSSSTLCLVDSSSRSSTVTSMTMLFTCSRRAVAVNAMLHVLQSHRRVSINDTAATIVPWRLRITSGLTSLARMQFLNDTTRRLVDECFRNYSRLPPTLSTSNFAYSIFYAFSVYTTVSAFCSIVRLNYCSGRVRQCSMRNGHLPQLHYRLCCHWHPAVLRLHSRHF